MKIHRIATDPRRLLLSIALTLSLLHSSADVMADGVGGRPARILSGDSLIVIGDNGQRHQVRLAGIKAPQGDRGGGAAARRQLQMRVLGKPVRIEVLHRGPGDRLLGRMLLGGSDVGLGMLAAGLVRYRPGELGSRDAAAYRTAAEQARHLGLGLWSSLPRP